MVGGSLVFYGATTLLGVDPGFLREKGAWPPKAILVLAASLISGALCGLLGLSLGANVRVASKKADHRIAVFWHCLANGALVWSFLLLLILTKLFGQESAKDLFDRLGHWYSTFAIGASCALGSLTIAALFLVTGQMTVGSRTRFVRCVVISLPVSLTMSYAQFQLLGLSTLYWLAAGIIFPFALVPSVSMMIARDARQRKVLNEWK